MKVIRIVSIVVLAIVAINAIAAGYSFMSDPSGNGLGISENYLQYSPFKNYFIPGLILFTANGLFNIGALISILLKWRYYPWFIMFQGAVLLGWIGIQVAMLHELNFLHGIFIVTGILLVFFGFRLKSKSAESIKSI